MPSPGTDSHMSLTAEEIYASLETCTADGLVACRPDGKITRANPAFCRLVGRPASELLGVNLNAIMHCSCHDEEGKAEANGSLRLVCGSADAPNVHNAMFAAGSTQEQSLAVSHIALGAGPTELLTVVYIVQASTVQQAQTDFVSTVSHELRTPLTSIKGFADTILRAGDRLDVAQQRRYVGIIKDQADRLARLVEDLLAVSRLESRKLQLTIRAIELEQMVQRVVRNLSDKAENHQILTRIPPGLPAVWADADRLEQILTNLLDNAIKYSYPDTTVTVSARLVESKSGESAPEMVEFEVADQGVGIPKEHLSEIFSKFSRMDNPLVRQTEGTGLGLYITRSLVLALGGTICVASDPGRTTFTVCLPAATLEQQAARGRG